jgi:hypothetical protein
MCLPLRPLKLFLFFLFFWRYFYTLCKETYEISEYTSEK